MDIRELPAQASPELFRNMAKNIVKAFRSGDSESLRSLQDLFKPEQPLTREIVRTGIKNRIRKLAFSGIRKTRHTLLNRLNLFLKKLYLQLKPLSLKDAQLLIASEFGFSSFSGFERFIEEMNRKGSSVSKFELAVDAVINGDLPTLRLLLRDNPELIRTRSLRFHQASLLHYTSANGIEDFRQKTPKNAVEVLKILLKANAEVDMVLADGESTTLGLIATSVHPLVAGLQIEMLEILLAAGASVNGIKEGWNPLTSALANGRGKAAEFLASRGAILDLEGAAGVGLLDLVKKFFNEDGSLKSNTTIAHMMSGFAWACEYGRTKVVEFLLQKGIDVNAFLRHSGQTGLHWAAYGGHPQTVKLLLDNKANVNSKDKRYDGTPLGWALYGWVGSYPEFNSESYYEVVELLVTAGAEVKPEWLANPNRELPIIENIHADARMLAALKGNLSQQKI
jgi:ankyrin repeat protein